MAEFSWNKIFGNDYKFCFCLVIIFMDHCILNYKFLTEYETQ